jgi:hypothetical protein
LILRLQLLGHHLDDRDIVALRFGAVSPQTLARSPQEAFRAAKLREELFQEYFEPFPVCGLSSAGFFRQKISMRSDAALMTFWRYAAA